MNKEDITRMAREVGVLAGYEGEPEYLERFAALVAAAEREACAKVCDGFWLNGRYLTDVADSIRARSNT